MEDLASTGGPLSAGALGSQSSLAETLSTASVSNTSVKATSSAGSLFRMFVGDAFC